MSGADSEEGAGAKGAIGERADTSPRVPAVAARRDASNSAVRVCPRPPRQVGDGAAEPVASERRDATAKIALRMRPVAEADAPAFARFGRFDLLGRVAVGGMAEILLARESIEGAGSRHVIIKVVRGEFAEDGEFARMFLDEGRLAMRLTHPNICQVHECGRHEGRFFMAMEYVHGRTLRDVLLRAAARDRPLPIPVLIRVFAIVAEALDSAHRAKDALGRELSVVHRDVSPHNIMIRYDGVVKLLDFGVAKAEHSQHSTESGALKGKFGYMSPEQAMGDSVDARADVFSLGVCMFEAITGRRLHHRKTQYDTLKAILETTPPPLSTFRDEVPARLEEIVQRALAKDRTQRYQRAGDLQHDLDALLTDLREVVSTARIGALMEELFRDEAHRGPELEVNADLRERYGGQPHSLEPTMPGLPAKKLSRGIALTAAVLLAASALSIASVWLASSSPSARNQPPRPDPPPSANAPAPGIATPEPAQRRAMPMAPRSAAPPAAAGPTERSAASEPNSLSSRAASSDTLAGQEPTRTPRERASGGEEESTFRPSSSRRTRTTPGERTHGRRRRGTVIVTDPGF